MFAGVSGLRSHQTMMDVVGNNIANVNTAGYKSAQVTFEETLAQTLQGPAGAGTSRGGTNPLQIGLGVKVASIDGVFTQGATQVTGRPTDLAISGDADKLKMDSGKNSDAIYLTRYDNAAHASIKLGSDNDNIIVASTAQLTGTVKLNGGTGSDVQTVASGAYFFPILKGMEGLTMSDAADAVCDSAIADLISDYIGRGGDPADLPC